MGCNCFRSQLIGASDECLNPLRARMGCNPPTCILPNFGKRRSQSSPGEDGLQPSKARTSTTMPTSVSILSGRGWVATAGMMGRAPSDASSLNPLRARMGCNNLLRYSLSHTLSMSQSSPGEDGLQRHRFRLSRSRHLVSILSGRGWVATAGNANPVRSEGSEQENRNRWH